MFRTAASCYSLCPVGRAIPEALSFERVVVIKPEMEETLVLVAILHGKKCVDEVVQYVTKLREWKLLAHLREFNNFVDFVYIVTGWWAILPQFITVGNRLEKVPWAMLCAMAWLRALYALRCEVWMGPRLLPILSALKDTMAFMVLTASCVAGATHAYYVLQLRDEPSPFYAAITQIVRLGIFGDFDMFEFEGLDPTHKFNHDTKEWEPQDPDPGPNYGWAHALFYITGVGITVLLMNLLIAVLGQNFELYQEKCAILFLRERASMLLELQNRIWAHFPKRIVRWLQRCCGGCILARLTCGALLLLLLPLLFPLILVLAALVVMSWCIFNVHFSGIKYVVAVGLGYCGDRHTRHQVQDPDYLGFTSAEKSRIWVLTRKERPMEDMRSLRFDLKNRVDDLEKKLTEQMGSMEKRSEASSVAQKSTLKDVELKLLWMENTLQTLTGWVQKLAGADPTG